MIEPVPDCPGCPACDALAAAIQADLDARLAVTAAAEIVDAHHALNRERPTRSRAGGGRSPAAGLPLAGAETSSSTERKEDMADFSGTWKAFASKAKAPPPATPKRPARKPRPKRPADALHLLGSLDPKPEGYVVLGAPPLPERPAVVEAGYVDGVRTGGKVTLPASAPASLHPAGGRVHAIGMKRGVRGPEAVIAWLAKRSVVVELVDGKLVAYASRGQMVDTTRELLTKATPLLTAHLSGEPLRCAWPHKEKTPPAAVSVVEPGLAPICEAHLLEDRP